MFVALMPFSTSALANYASTLAQIIFSGDLIVLGLLLMANWIYATGKHRLVDPDLDQGTITKGIRRTLVTIGVAALTIIVSIFYPVQSSFTYFLILIIFLLPPFRHR